MKTRIAVLMVIILTMLACAALAEATSAPDESAGPFKALGLSKDHIQQVHQILRQYRADIADAFKQPGTRDVKKGRVQALKAKTIDAINAVLTPEQLAKAKETGVVERIVNRATKRQAGLMLALKRLDLTDDQKARTKAIFDEQKTKAKAIMDDSSLTPEQRRAALVELRKDTREKIKAILTPEQQEKLERIMKNRGGRGARPAK